MDDKNELSDIVLEKDNGKVLKAKRILIIIALLIIVFLGVLVTMKLINKPTQNTATEKMILPPEPKSVTDSKAKDEELFKQVPIIEENKTNKDNFDNIVKNLKEKEMQKSQISDQNQTKPVQTQSQTIQEKPVAPVVEPLKKEAKKILKPKIEQKTQKTTPTAKNKGLFVQVGAIYRGTPSKKFLKLITDKHYNYFLYKTKVNNKSVTKVLIGPFKTTKEAKAGLIEIKKSINKNAFLYRVK
ncbi:MAG: SPOR domain-containing protein [Sulfurospirillaceae bacterium]|nr:SPOR domain-containing protein [Sulfurospirillaceae bacterium]